MRAAQRVNAVETIGALVAGFVTFLAVVGPRVLDPYNVAWLAARTDRFQHYVGWLLYRNSPFAWTIGRSFDNGIELSNSVVFSDSIPLAAVAWKYLVVPSGGQFHYFGLWILTAFLLQALIGYRLIALATPNCALRFAALALILFCPAFLDRIGLHMALGGHWILLAALWLALSPPMPGKPASWLLLLALVAWVHAYLLAMVLGLWLADLLVRRARASTPRAIEVELLAAVAVVALSIWQSGCLTIGKGVNEEGFGLNNMNLLAPFTPQGWSWLLPELPRRAVEMEGFNFLGLGTLLLVAAALVLLALRKARVRAAATGRLVPVLIVLAGMAVFAVSNEIYLGHAHVSVPIPDALHAIANFFRSSGRMFWPVYYFAVLAAVWIVAHALPLRGALALVALAAVLQVADTSAGWLDERRTFEQPRRSELATGMTSPFWAQASKRYDKLRWVMPWNATPQWQRLAYFAGTHHMATDAVYLARIDVNAMRAAREKARQAIATGRFEADSLYVFDAATAVEIARHYDAAHDAMGRIDGLYVLAPGWKSCPDCGTFPGAS